MVIDEEGVPAEVAAGDVSDEDVGAWRLGFRLDIDNREIVSLLLLLRHFGM